MLTFFKINILVINFNIFFEIKDHIHNDQLKDALKTYYIYNFKEIVRNIFCFSYD